MSTTEVRSCESTQDRRRRLRAQALTIAAAATVAIAGWIVVRLVGVDLLVKNGDHTEKIGLPAAALVSVAAGFCGIALLALLERFTGRPRRAWYLTATIVLLVSFLGPLSAATVAAGFALTALHLLVGSTVIIGLATRPRC